MRGLGLAAGMAILGAEVAASPQSLYQITPQLACYDSGEIYNWLKGIGERMVGYGFAPIEDNREVIMELWVDEDGGWTVLSTSPRGTSCLVMFGAGWQQQPLVAGVEH